MEQAPSPRKPLRAVLFYAALSFTAFFPCLVLGKSYDANDLLYFFGPMRAFLQDRLAHGSFPLWNPYIFCGQPFFADLQNMMLYPPHLLSLLFPTPYGLSFFFFLHMLLAACGMYFWLGTLRLSEGSCFMGGLLFALSGFFWWEIIHPPVLAAYACLPWLFGSLEKFSRDLKWNWAFGAGFSFAFLFLAGSLQVTLGGFYGGLAYWLLRVRPSNFGLDSWKGLLKSPVWRRKAAIALFFLVWGAFPLLGQLVPTAEFSKYSVRRTPDLTYENFNGAFSLQPSNLTQFLFPAFGLPPGETMEAAIQQVQNGGDVDFLGNFGYLGAWIPFLLFLALRKKDRGVLPFLLMGALLCVLVSFGKYFLLHRLFCGVVPGFSIIRAPFRFLYFYVLCACAAAAFGFQELERAAGQKEKHPYLLTGFMVYGAFFTLFSLARFENTWRETLAGLLGLAGMGLWFQTQSWLKMGRLFFQFALVVPLLFFGWSTWSPSPPENYDFGKNSILAQLNPPAWGRLVVMPDVPYLEKSGAGMRGVYFPMNGLMAQKIRALEGYNPLHLKKTDNLFKIKPPVLYRLAAVEQILSARDENEIPGYLHQTVGGSYHFYRSQEANGFVSAPPEAKVVPDEQETLALLQDPAFPAGRLALLDKPLPPEASTRDKDKPARLAYELTLDQPDHQTFKIQLDAPNLVVFSEVVYPGWKAWVDGRPAGILTANYIFRGLFIPAGTHQVEFKYEPFWWPWIPFGLALWFLSLPLLGWFYRRGLAPQTPVPSRT
jgi:hypothetical protein